MRVFDGLDAAHLTLLHALHTLHLVESREFPKRRQELNEDPKKVEDVPQKQEVPLEEETKELLIDRCGRGQQFCLPTGVGAARGNSGSLRLSEGRRRCLGGCCWLLCLLRSIGLRGRYYWIGLDHHSSRHE